MALVSERPGSAAPRPWRFPTFERRRLDSGLHVLLADVPGRPLAAARLVLDAGGTAEPPGRAGVATLAARALPEGTEDLDGPALAVALEALGAEVRGELNWDSMQVRLDVPASRLGPALELLAEIVRRPGLRATEVDRLRQERLDQISNEKVDPNVLALRAFERSVFVPGSTYARPLQGDEGTVGDLDAGTVADFYRARLEAGPATLVVAGDLAGLDVPALAERAFGAWNSGPFEPTPADVHEVDEPGHIIVVDRPGSVQSVLHLGHTGPARNTPDYVAVGMMSTCLGGVFGSRLNMKLREERGYTYGAFAGFDFRRHGGTFSARSAVHTEVTAPALADAVEEITHTHDAGIDEAELAPVREYRVGIFPIAYETPAAVAAGLADLVVHDLPDGYFDAVREDMANVTADVVTKAAAAHLRPKRLAMVVVGEAEKITADLEATGLGPVDSHAE
ncbi:MAG TPA: pitrilysin family protein [Acidimicrobiales bacterium]|nr:pitrilysin family protein [Acidimicrobiales bacterium]